MDLVEIQNRKHGEVKRHPWELARFEVVDTLLQGIIKNQDGFNVLDIGCGDVFFISGLSERYPKASFYAIDIAFTDEIILKLKETVRGKNIFLFKTLEEANLHLKKSADLVLLLDVVEHIQDDNGFLLSLYNNPAVTSNTRVMITVPAYQGLFCSHDHFLGHYRRYTNKTLIKTIRAAGFEKEKSGYFFLSLLPPRMVQVLREKISKPDLNNHTTGLVEWNGGAGISGLIKNFLLLDFKITNAFKKLTGLSLPGLSNYIVCKKPA